MKIVLLIVFVWIVYSLCKKGNDAGGRPPRVQPGMRTCYDCKHCDSGKQKAGQCYCRWDNEYYYPETGSSCDDFVSFTK